eukprot:CAMPEP_0167783312 /NCGR_PEP_ID=MMETSP0111_2-20121227/7001_1 /TAXON_ID=91324 /ORGANISM="Lotharella globosa, Strain CCCM811" /LENGTH=942 /DNA_ID=CAMNT_0007674237 /DNA_START=129 /DNA_END=2957 /DNA_ORIENTATION=+
MGMHRWQVRYFALYDDRLDYYRTKEDPQPLGSIPTHYILKVLHLPQKRGGARFDITCDGESERVFSLLAESQHLCQKWVKELKEVLAVAARKPKISANIVGTGKVWKNNRGDLGASHRIEQKHKSNRTTDGGVSTALARDLGYVCGKLLMNFRPGYGSVYKCSKSKERFHGLLHIVPKDSENIKTIQDYHNNTMASNMPYLMKPEVQGGTADAIFMVYEHGRSSLYSHLKGHKRLSESKVRTLSAEVCIALTNLHHDGLTFPLLRPEHIFLTPRGRVRLVDCWHNSGLGKHAYDVKTIVSEYVTPDYITEKKDDCISDWWRLGVLMYELICGIPPFHSLKHDRSEIINKIRNFQTYLPTLQFPKGISPSLKRFILALLSDRSKREHYMDRKNIENEPFFMGIDFDALARREEAEADLRIRNQAKRFTYRYDIRFTLAEARDLQFGKFNPAKSVSCGLKASGEPMPHVTAPVQYTQSHVHFEQRNRFVIETLSLDTMLKIFCHTSNPESKLTTSGVAQIKLADIMKVKAIDKGTVFEKWIDLFGTDSTNMGDVLVKLEIEEVHSNRHLLESVMPYKKFFEIPEMDKDQSQYNEIDLLDSTISVSPTEASAPGESPKASSNGANSKQKRNKRVVKDGYDLDMSYITPRLVAMSFPSDSAQSHGNPMKKVQGYLNRYHPLSHRVFNLCSERRYPASRFDTCTSEYSIDPQGCPDLQRVLDFCLDVDNFLTNDEKSVVVVHCTHGRSRTGLMLACYMLFAEIQPSAATALRLFSKQRTNDGKAVSIPSHRRYVSYFERYLRQYHWCDPPRVLDFNGHPLVMHHVRVSLVRDQGLTFAVLDSKRRVLYRHEAKRPVAYLDTKLNYLEHTCTVPMAGDRKIELVAGKKYDSPIGWLWINTNFVGETFASFTRDKLDGVSSKSEKILGADFKIELFFLSKEEMELKAIQ